MFPVKASLQRLPLKGQRKQDVAQKLELRLTCRHIKESAKALAMFQSENKCVLVFVKQKQLNNSVKSRRFGVIVTLSRLFRLLSTCFCVGESLYLLYNIRNFVVTLIFEVLLSLKHFPLFGNHSKVVLFSSFLGNFLRREISKTSLD